MKKMLLHILLATITVTTPPAVTNTKINMSGNSGTCTLNGASPSTCTVTNVTAGALCQCTNVGASAAIAANGCAVGLSSTTLTVTSANGATNVVNTQCDR